MNTALPRCFAAVDQAACLQAKGYLRRKCHLGQGLFGSALGSGAAPPARLSSLHRGAGSGSVSARQRGRSYSQRA